jgi:hypothetical protein
MCVVDPFYRRQSVFCFQPIGDLPTRKGLFDGLLMGCIPVVFDIQTAENMYTWHWEQAFWEQVLCTNKMSQQIHPCMYWYLCSCCVFGCA